MGAWAAPPLGYLSAAKKRRPSPCRVTVVGFRDTEMDDIAVPLQCKAKSHDASPPAAGRLGPWGAPMAACFILSDSAEPVNNPPGGAARGDFRAGRNLSGGGRVYQDRARIKSGKNSSLHLQGRKICGMLIFVKLSARKGAQRWEG